MTSPRVVNLSRFIGLPAVIAILLVWSLFSFITHVLGEESGAKFYVAMSMIGLTIFAFYRAERQNPATNARYGQWLRKTPWAWGRPLPLGPVRLSFADAVIVTLFALLFPLGFLVGLIIGATAFAFGYVLSVTICCWAHGDWLLPTGAAFLFGLGIAFSIGPDGPSPRSLLVALLASLLLSQIAIPRVLKRFDTLVPPEPLLRTQRGTRYRSVLNRSNACGSPWDPLLKGLAPRVATPNNRAWRALLVAIPLLVSWLALCIEIARYRLFDWATTADEEVLMAGTTIWDGFRFILYSAAVQETNGMPAADTAEHAGLVLGMLTLLSVAFSLVCSRVAGHWPPLNLLGRIATRRFIVPGYDYVFLGALASVLVYGTVAGLTILLTNWDFLGGGLALAASLPVLFKFTPSMEEWRLTGHHRILCG